MSLNLPLRRLLKPAVSASWGRAARTLHTTPPANGLWSGRRDAEKETKKAETKAEIEPTAKQPTELGASKRLLQRLMKERTEGDSIFSDELTAVKKQREEAGLEEAGAEGEDGEVGTREERELDNGAFTVEGSSLESEHMARATDPDPRSRLRWARRAVIKRVAIGTNPFSREPRAQRIARTERQLMSSSPLLATSVKKLQPLAMQVAGKSVSEALLQMRFSKKKMAVEVGVQLELARDMAIVERGMGLGMVNGEAFPAGKEVEVKTKNGKFVKVDDPTRLYVAQAWVNRGPWRGFSRDYRARGRGNRICHPSTSE